MEKNSEPVGNNIKKIQVDSMIITSSVTGIKKLPDFVNWAVQTTSIRLPSLSNLH